MSLSFDGEDDYVDCGNDASLRITGSLTMEAWINPDRDTTDEQILGRQAGPGDYHYAIQYSNGKARVAVSDSGTNWTYRDSSNVYGTGSWIHIVGVFNSIAQTLDVFVNSVLDNGALTGSIPSSIYAGSINFAIGNRINQTLPFQGIIGDVRVYNRALLQDEIKDNMNGRVTTEGLVLWIPFREGSGTTAHDISGEGNNGTLLPEGSEPTWAGRTSKAVAITSHGSEALAFLIDRYSPFHIFRAESNDNGETWGDWIDTGLASDADGVLAATHKGNGDVCLLYSRGSTLYSCKRENGTWGAEAVWTNSLQSITGVGVFYEGDWNVIVTGIDPSGRKGVWTCVYGDGYSQSIGSWSALAELAIASSGSDVGFCRPSLSFPDVFRAFFVEEYEGSSPYVRSLWSHSLASAEFISNLWREPVPFDFSSTYGLSLNYRGQYAWLCCPFGVWRAELFPSSIDVTQDVIALDISCEPFSGRARIELRNDDGRYGGIGSGSYAAIEKGSEIVISPGYRTAAGIEVSSGLSYWIEGWEYVSQGGQADFVIQASDGWGLLGHWRARRQFSWAEGAKNVFQLLAFIFARAGLEFSAFSSSDMLLNHYPAFTIHPEESGALAVSHLLEMVSDVLFFRRHYGYIVNPKADDPSAYSYGTGHPIYQGRYRAFSPRANRIQVFGDGVLGEGFDWEGISRVYDRLEQVHDINLSTAEEVQGRADAELHRHKLAAQDGEVIVPMNCGQELYDVIEVTDERAGLLAQRKRVLGLRLLYSPERARCEQRLRLGGV
jgi:hypothetical protein